MGRLTLNILLSFAQFEREVIGERVRDKIACAACPTGHLAETDCVAGHVGFELWRANLLHYPMAYESR
jgi:hypothetical protein